MFQESELFNLVLAIISLLFLAGFRKARTDLPPTILTGFYCLVVAYFSTLAEGYVMPVLFNLVEHLAIAISGILFAFGCRSLVRSDQGPGGPHDR